MFNLSFFFDLSGVFLFYQLCSCEGLWWTLFSATKETSFIRRIKEQLGLYIWAPFQPFIDNWRNIFRSWLVMFDRNRESHRKFKFSVSNFQVTFLNLSFQWVLFIVCSRISNVQRNSQLTLKKLAMQVCRVSKHSTSVFALIRIFAFKAVVTIEFWAAFKKNGAHFLLNKNYSPIHCKKHKLMHFHHFQIQLDAICMKCWSHRRSPFHSADLFRPQRH